MPTPIPDLEAVAIEFDLGDIVESRQLDGGNVQTNIMVLTASGRYVVRLYHNRSHQSALFETKLLQDLKRVRLPCPGVVQTPHGQTVIDFGDRPVAVFTLMEGVRPDHLGRRRRLELIRAVAKLHAYTVGQTKYEDPNRWNYTVDFAVQRLREAAAKSQLCHPRAKLRWLEARVTECILPTELPRGICHCDFDPSNLLFLGDRLNAILDFDDANYTWLPMDLINLMENYYWRIPDRPDWNSCVALIADYQQYRPLVEAEKIHMFDMHRLQAAIDSAWFFDAGEYGDFVGRRRIDFLDSIGRENYRKNVGLA